MQYSIMTEVDEPESGEQDAAHILIACPSDNSPCLWARDWRTGELAVTSPFVPGYTRPEQWAELRTAVEDRGGDLLEIDSCNCSGLIVELPMERKLRSKLLRWLRRQ